MCLPLLLNIVLEVLVSTRKDCQEKQKRRKKSASIHNKNIYVENSKESTKNILELISDCTKIPGYKVI